MNLNVRLAALAEYLAESGGPITIREIAAHLGVSARTVRYDLGDLEARLEQAGLRLSRRPRVGISIEGLDDGGPADLKRLLSTTDTSPLATRESRIQRLILWLLHENEGISLGIICRRMYVSPTTARRDIARARAWLQVRSVSLISSRGLYRVAGSELGMRQCLADMLLNAVGETSLLYRWASNRNMDSGLIGKFLGLGVDVDLGLVEGIVRDAVKDLAYPIAESSVVGIVFHVAVAVKRLRDGNYADMLPVRPPGLESAQEYSVARDITSRISEVFGLDMPEMEAAYIALHLLGAKVRTAPRARAPGDAGESRFSTANGPPVDSSIVELARQYASRAGAILSAPLENDEQLVLSLAIHLQPAVQRLRCGLCTRNPILDLIKERHPLLFYVAGIASRYLEEETGVRIPEEEVGYLAAHLGASLERLTGPRPIRAVLVCPSGVGTSELLRTSIVRRFPYIEIVGVAPASEAASVALSSGAEVVITTVPLKVSGAEVVLVEPVMSDDDTREIESALNRVSGKQRKRSSAGVGVSKAAAESGGPYMLQDVLTDDTIQFDVDAETWEEAVTEAGRLMVNAGYVEEQYIGAMISLVKEVGPYIVVGPGIAMPHARPECGVRRVGASLVRLRTPVVFPGKETNPVRLVLAFAAESNNRHLGIMAQLAAILSDSQRMRMLLESADPRQIIEMVKEVEVPEELD